MCVLILCPQLKNVAVVSRFTAPPQLESLTTRSMRFLQLLLGTLCARVGAYLGAAEQAARHDGFYAHLSSRRRGHSRRRHSRAMFRVAREDADTETREQALLAQGLGVPFKESASERCFSGPHIDKVREVCGASLEADPAIAMVPSSARTAP